jgi:hypothetical protein
MRRLLYGQPVNISAPLNHGLMGWWKVLPQRFGGLRFLDLLGRYHGTLTGIGASSATSGWGSTTRLGGSGELRFDGSNDYIAIPAAAALDPPEITMACWVKGTNWTPAYSGIISTIDGTATNYHSCEVTSAGHMTSYVKTSGGAPQIDPGVATIPTGTWTHLAMTYNSVAGLAQYVNGLPDATAAAAGTLVATGAQTWLTNDQFNTGRFLTGAMDDVRIYNRALSAEEVRRLVLASRLGYPLELNWLPSWGHIDGR